MARRSALDEARRIVTRLTKRGVQGVKDFPESIDILAGGVRDIVNPQPISPVPQPTRPAFSEVVKREIPTLPQQVSSSFRGVGSVFAPQIQPFVSATANALETAGTGTLRIGGGVSRLPKDILQLATAPTAGQKVAELVDIQKDVVDIAFGTGNLLALDPRSKFGKAFFGATTGTQIPFDPLQRFSAGFLRSQTGIPTLVQEVKGKPTQVAGIQVDPFEVLGGLVGFTFNPIWARIFPKTSQLLKISPFQSKIGNFVFQRLSKGGIEGYIDGIGKLKKGASFEDKAKVLLTNMGFGAVAELGVDTVLKSAGLVGDPRRITKIMVKIADTISDEIKKESVATGFFDHVTGQRVVMPLWQKRLLDKGIDIRSQRGELQLGSQEKNIPGSDVHKTLVDSFQKGRELKQVGARRAADVRTQLLDRLTPIFDLIKQSGKDLSAEKNPYKRMRVLSGIAGHVDSMLETGLGPVLRKNSEMLDDLSSLLIVERTQEIQRQGLKTFLSKGQVAKELQYLRLKHGNEGFAALRQSAVEIRAYGQKLLVMLRQAGIIDKKSFRAIRRKNEFYVPFEIIDYISENAENNKFTRASYNVASQDVIKRLKGNKKALGDPLESFVKKTGQVVALVEKNKALRGLVDFMQRDFPDLITLITDKKDVSKGMDTINVFINGENTRFAVPKEIAAAVKALDAESANILLSIGRVQAKILRAGATGLNIGFIPANIVKDIADALFGEASEQGLRGAWGLLASYPAAVAASLKRNDLYHKWLRSGGAQSTLTEQVFKKTPQTVKKLAGQRSMIKEVISTPVKLVEFANRVGEQSTRIARFKVGLERGETPVEAAFKSRDITVDFAKAGDKIKLLNQVIPFLNAGIQGTERLFRVLKDNPKRGALAIGILGGIPTVMLYANNRRFKDYTDIREFEKNLNWILIYKDRTPEERANGDKLHAIKIPKGHLIQPFAATTEAFMQFIDQNDPQSLSNFIAETIENVSPVGFPIDKERAGKTFSQLLPPGVQAGVEGISNFNLFKGRAIVPRSLEGVAPSQQFRESTPEALVKIGKITGLSPLQLQNLIQTTTGGVGRQLTEIASGNIRKGTIGQITRRFKGVRGGENIDKQFEEVANISQVSKTKSLKRKRKAEKIYQLMKSNPEKARGILIQVARRDPLVIDKVKQVQEQDKLGLTSIDRFVKALPVKDGSRARYIKNRLSKIKSKEAKRAFLIEMAKKKIATKEVLKQLKQFN